MDLEPLELLEDFDDLQAVVPVLKEGDKDRKSLYFLSNLNSPVLVRIILWEWAVWEGLWSELHC